ncbi:S-layer homology domain-containing protein [Thermoanaerobacterium thermosaccharolyticum]|uniref:S-layer homology domain-containing protein n=1 Tax=Thermoanaerobacterium thermosaccharolyticum TaxID=1517 RepID=UPI001238D91E|nr:S-layer homology domain-containing protein [Thermoanaerobacterium thermosaccharolyticum]KAA5806794.1 peptidase M4 [Thermoanaerobacterium thermosaccharolyticum]
MRKFLSFLIVIVLIFTIAIPSIGFAQTNSKIELKQAIEIAKEKLNIPSSGYNFNSNYNENDNNNTWYLTWSSSTNGNINVSVDADTGEIISYNFYKPDNTPVSIIPKHTREEAKEVAVNFLNKIVPEKFKETKEQETDDYAGLNPKIAYSTAYSFNFIRIVNGIPFQGNQITVEVNKNTLDVQSYYLTWGSDYNFPNPKSAISKDKAIQIYKDNNSLNLQYSLVYTDVYGNNESTPQAILVYSLINNQPVDAINGKILHQGYYGPYMGGMGAKSDSSQALSPEEQKAVDDISKYISKDKAIELAKEKLPFTIGSQYSLTSSALYKNNSNSNSATWNFSWTCTEGNNYNYISAAIDATTGELKTFYRNDSNENNVQGKSPKYTKDQLKSIAENYLNEIQLEKFKQMEYQDNPASEDDNSPYTTFNYIYKANGIPCPFNSINIGVNKYTGDIVTYNLSWTDVKLPDNKNVISLDDAYKTLFNNSDFQLSYIIYYAPDKVYQSNSKDIRLVYQLTNFDGLIDANSGTYIDYSGKPILKNENKQFTDITGNWAEKDILLLAQFGIADGKDGKYMPNDYILQKDFIKMLVKSLQPNNVIIPLTSNEDENYDNYYNVAINNKIITESEKNPDTKVTRQDAAKFIVRSLGLKYVADINGIYTLDYLKDAYKIDNSLKGYVAIVYGLNIMTGNNGYFNPSENLTRAQVASILVRYLRVEK